MHFTSGQLALSDLQTKAEAEISKAQKLISEKDAELQAAEGSLSELEEVLHITFCLDWFCVCECVYTVTVQSLQCLGLFLNMQGSSQHSWFMLILLELKNTLLEYFLVQITILFQALYYPWTRNHKLRVFLDSPVDASNKWRNKSEWKSSGKNILI